MDLGGGRRLRRLARRAASSRVASIWALTDRLLTAKHGFGDLRGVGEVGDSGFEDFNARVVGSFLQFDQQVRVDFAGRADEGGDVVLVECVVGVGAGQLPDRRLGLGVDVGGEVVDTEYSAGGVDDSPHDHRGDLDRIASGVIHL